jgi:hypothetical protein
LVSAVDCCAVVGRLAEKMKLMVSVAPVSANRAVMALPELLTRWTGKVPARNTSVGLRALGLASVLPLR